MSLHILNQDNTSIKLANLINVCKSSSGTQGRVLRHAHKDLGLLMADELVKDSSYKNFVVIAMMRAGFFYAEGIADRIDFLGYPVSLFTFNKMLTTEELDFIQGKEVLIVDAVINTGKTILNLQQQLPNNCAVKVSTTVIPQSSLDLAKNIEIYTIRISENQYKGTKTQSIHAGFGPDTGDRLFNTMDV